MRPISQILLIMFVLIFTLSFSDCGDTKRLQENPPVKVLAPSFQKWISGRKEGGTGIKIYIPVVQENKAITLKLIYFRGRVTPLMLQGDNSKLYVGDFKIPYKNARDIVMNADPKKEAVNTLPEPVFDPPFELQDDEAVISYEKKGKTYFFKVKNIKEKAVLVYPSRKKNEKK